MLANVARKVEVEELFEDLLEGAFLAGLIDGLQLALAYSWLAINHQDRNKPH